ncbi:MAG: MerR family DNA-binding transcriptional regulator [Ardenticatenaceae bacterium]
MDDQLTIGELAKRTRVTTKTVRYYEKIGLLVPVARGDNQYRYYTTPWPRSYYTVCS